MPSSASATNPPALAITAGEPAGIGPDILLQCATRPQAGPLVAIADPDLLSHRATQLGLDIDLVRWAPPTALAAHRPGILPVYAVPARVPPVAGTLDVRNAAYVIQTLDSACEQVLDGTLAALVTAPVHKGVLNEAGIPFSGHTEFLCERTDAQRVLMMLASPAMRVALVTTHLPLRAVADAITGAAMRDALEVLDSELRTRFGIKRPRILVAGLNPHAGEGGHLGTEEVDIIAPAVDALREQGMDLHGPLPADTLFRPDYLRDADAVLAMYHDQGLPVLKSHGFGQAVNISLGLPLVRTSPDHGTALDLAGSGRADTGSMQAAIDMALQMAAPCP
ncbi:MAG: 4-hydroxythreonine-4-phosphate dehydrogenase PdxA [Cellvibrionales bacterium]|nr:4-hydroxythreonine-4-phosphate dehydrogenase PdxA [Cellvibrionales bacterium]